MIGILAQASPSGALSAAQTASSQAQQASGLWVKLTTWINSIDPKIWMWVGIGLASIIILLLGYWLFLRLRRRHRARQLRSRLGKHMAVTSAPSADKTHDFSDLRRKFMQGLSELQRSGRDLYTLPWYLVLGDSGAGKSEAIRNSGLDFPEGLNEPRQGLGGTVNMDWWFSNYAVLLDTAGRMLLEGLETGRTPEWDEFLRLLKKHRPNCPINGVVLAIPADSLLLDEQEKLDAKMRALGEQLYTIQKVLDIRFPVYVMVTKLDLVVGADSLFESRSITGKPDQIFGWSNPEDLETPFRAELLNEGMQSLQTRVRELVFDALKDYKIFGDELKASCMQQLPSDFSRISRRLSQSLEELFLPGQWTTKPLFLRGVFFTSARQSGEPLDPSLADLLQSSEDHLDRTTETSESRRGIIQRLAARYPMLRSTEAIQRISRPFFLGDLFQEKIVREYGLVTRASNALRRLRRRRLTLFWTGIGLAALFVALSCWVAFSQNKAIHQQKTYWTDANSRFYFLPGTQVLQWSPITDPKTSQYYGYRPLTLFHTDEQVLLEQYQANLAHLADADFNNYLLFQLYSWGEKKKRQRAQRVIFDTGVLGPLILNASTQIISAGEWSPDLTKALGSLIRLNADLELAKAGKDAQTPDATFLSGLLSVVNGAPANTPHIDEAFNVAFDKGNSNQYWPPAWLEAYFIAGEESPVPGQLHEANVFRSISSKGLNDGLDGFLDSLMVNAKGQTNALAKVRDLVKAVSDYQIQETRFFRTVTPLVDHPINYETVEKSLAQLLEANQTLTEKINSAMHDGLFGDGAVTLQGALDTQNAVVEDALSESLQSLRSQLQSILKDQKVMSQLPGLANLNDQITQKAAEVQAWLHQQIPKELRGEISQLDASYMLKPGPNQAKFYQIRMVSIMEAIIWLRDSNAIQYPRVGTLSSTILFTDSPLTHLRYKIAGRFALSYPAFFNHMVLLMDSIDTERDRVLVDSYLKHLSEKISQNLKFPLTYPPVKHALMPPDVIHSMGWIGLLKEDLQSPNVTKLADRDIDSLQGVLDGLSLIPPMFGALFEPMAEGKPLPPNTNKAQYRTVLPLGQGDSNEFRLGDKGYELATASLYLLAYKDMVELDEDIQESHGVYEAAPPPKPDIEVKPTDDYAITGYTFKTVGPPPPTKRVPMGRAKKKNVSTEKKETLWHEQVADYYRARTPLPDIWRSIRITVENKAPLVFDTKQAKDFPLLEDISIATGTLKFELGTTSDNFNRNLEIEGHWSLIRMIMNDEARWHAKKKMWVVPYTFKDLTGRERYLWFGLSTKQPMPKRMAWPYLPSAQDQTQPEEAKPPQASEDSDGIDFYENEPMPTGPETKENVLSPAPVSIDEYEEHDSSHGIRRGRRML